MKAACSNFFKGALMGAADVVPGVSGGTVALIVGVYECLLTSLSAINFSLWQKWRKQGFLAVWQAINGSFLVSLGMGILVSIFSLSKLILFLLANYSELVWATFAGFMVASVVILLQRLSFWRLIDLVAMGIGLLGALQLTLASPLAGSTNLVYIFFAGFIGICAMILPGISGSFILVILGVYGVVLDAVRALDLVMISVFASGCIVGLLLFSRLLLTLLRLYHNITFALLVGFMMGSLNKLWPWKKVVSFSVNAKGQRVPLLEESVLPSTYRVLLDKDPQVLASVGLFVSALLVVLWIDYYQKRKVNVSS